MIIHVNNVDKIIYTNHDAIFGLSQNDFSRMVLEAKKNICNRRNVLERFEYWEIPDNDTLKLGMLLMSRAKTKEEKQLVTQYIKKES